MSGLPNPIANRMFPEMSPNDTGRIAATHPARPTTSVARNNAVTPASITANRRTARPAQSSGTRPIGARGSYWRTDVAVTALALQLFAPSSSRRQERQEEGEQIFLLAHLARLGALSAIQRPETVVFPFARYESTRSLPKGHIRSN